MKSARAYAEFSSEDCIACDACIPMCTCNLIQYGPYYESVFVDKYACNDCVCSAPCIEVCPVDAITLKYLPAAPTGLTLSSASGTYGYIKASWNAVSGSGNTYEVYRQDIDAGNGWSKIGTTASTFLIDTLYGYVPNAGNVTCQYKVRTINSDGMYSEFSAVVYVRAEPN